MSDKPKFTKKEEAVGCGCMALIAAIAIPVVTNLIGLSPWPMTILFLVYAAIVTWTKSTTGRLLWKSEALLALSGAAIAGLAGLWLSSAPASSDHSTEAPEPSIESPPAPVSTTQAKSEVRLSIDAIQDKFDNNQVAGAQFFKSHTAIIPGTVVRVREALGTGILVLRSDVSDLEMELGFDDRGTVLLGKLNPGDKMEATCPEVHEAMAQVLIVCTDIEKQ